MTVEKALEYRHRAETAEKELAKSKAEFHDIITEMQKQNELLRLTLADAQSKLRNKDWLIRKREEEADALKRELYSRHQGRLECGAETPPL
jgi:argonaute-like protein implicated in RNA metabolism and viral defense